MRHAFTSWRSLPALVAAMLLAVGACRNDVGPVAETQEAQLRVSAAVVGTVVDRIVATVGAADIPTSLVFNLPIADGAATGTLCIPPGAGRTITLRAFEPAGSISHEGTATIDVRAGSNPPVTIVMLPQSGELPITATIGSVSVVISPISATLEVGETRQFRAVIQGPDNLPVDGTVAWAVTNPAFAAVDREGTVTALAEGTLRLVATYAGVADISTLIIGGGGPSSPLSSSATRAQGAARSRRSRCRDREDGPGAHEGISVASGRYEAAGPVRARATRRT
jgi:hypothetical protein